MFAYYTTALFLNIFAMLILQTCVTKSNTLTTERKRLFHALFAVISIAGFCEWMGVLLQGKPESTRILHILVKIIELSLAPSIAFIFSWIFEKKWVRPITIYLICHAALECLSGFFGFIYRVDKSNVYAHAEFYWVYVAVYILSIVYVVFVVLRNIKKYQYGGAVFFLLVVFLMLTGIVIQLYRSDLKVDYITLGITSAMLYVFTLEMIQQTDELTGLLNRRGYENYLTHMDRPCIVTFFDVDKFKFINDTYGHAFGDDVLKSVGTAIRKTYAANGKCFRYGGDEFCVILTKNLDAVDTLNENFLHVISDLQTQNTKLPTVSIGHAYYDPKTQNIQDTVAKADAMMYAFKADRKTKSRRE